jgi:competence protein ComEA
MLMLKKFALFCVFLPSLFLNAYAVSPLNINSATAEQLSAVLSGVGDAKAKAIVAFRDQNGPFESIEELTKVKGIGNALLQRNKGFIAVIDTALTSHSETLEEAVP